MPQEGVPPDHDRDPRQSKEQPAILPRDRLGASRTVAYFEMAGAAMLIGMCAFIPGYGGPTTATTVATYATGTVVGALGVVCWRRPDLLPDAFWVVIPFVYILENAGISYITHDASVGAQLFFLWPTLYAATFLRRRLVLL